MNTNPVLNFLKKNTMVIALVVVVIFFQVRTGGSILLPTLLAGMGLGAAAIGRIKKTVSKVLSAFKTAAIVLLILYILLLLLR